MAITKKEIKAVRKKAGLRQVEFAPALGITQSHLSALEHGKYKVTRPIEMLIELKFGKELKEVTNE